MAALSDHAVDEVGLDEFLPDVALPREALRFGLRCFHCDPRGAVAGLVGGHAPIGEDAAGHALVREVVDEVLHLSGGRLKDECGRMKDGHIFVGMTSG